MPATAVERVYRDLTARSFEVRAESWDEKSRSFELTLSTEAPVMVMDMRRWEPIDEVLLSRGCKMPKSRQVPLLDSHNRYSVKEAQLGSARGIVLGDGQVTGRAHLASTEEDVAAKVREGHVTDCSVGYAVLASQRLEPGETAEVAGKSYTAGVRALRVTTEWMLKEVSTEWMLKEVSLCPIGADEDAKVREENAGGPPAQQKEDSVMADPTKVVPAAAAPVTQPVAAAEAPVRAEAPKPEMTPKELLRREVQAITPPELEGFARGLLLQSEMTVEKACAALLAEFTKMRQAAGGTPEPAQPGVKPADGPAQPTRLADVSAAEFARALRG